MLPSHEESRVLIVRCANCHTEFSLDDHQVGSEGATVRCSVCNYIFRVDPPAGGIEHSWQIRTIEDLLFTAPDLLTLQQWIEEGRLHPDDQVSRTGKHWLRLGDMPEFSRTFQGFQGLPQMVKPVQEEIGTAAALGPPPVYGSEGIGRRPPASMLDAVTRHVQDGRSSSGVIDSGSSAPIADMTREVRESSPSMRDLHDSLHGDRFIERSAPLARRRRWVWGALGIVAGVAVVFGVPPIRTALMGVAGGLVGDPAATQADPEPPELDLARQALQRLEPGEMGRAEATLQAAIDEGGRTPSTVASMKLAQVELLAVLAIQEQMLRALGRGEHEPRGHGERATAIFRDIAPADVIDRPRLKRARALLRLVEGRSADEIMALAAEGAPELPLWVRAAPLWRDSGAPVPVNLIGELRALEAPTMLSRLILGLAYARSGDAAATDALVADILRDVGDQPVALALRGVTGKEAPSSASATAPDPAGAPDKSSASLTAPAKSDGTKQEISALPTNGAEQVSAQRRLTVDQLIERGCSAVEGGKVSEGMELLRKAHDSRPGDLDVMVCMADGNARQGRWSAALALYERALARSPAYRAALSGAARASSRVNQTDKAISYYRRLLDIDPGNQTARTFLAEHGGSSPGGATAAQGPEDEAVPTP